MHKKGDPQTEMVWGSVFVQKNRYPKMGYQEGVSNYEIRGYFVRKLNLEYYIDIVYNCQDMYWRQKVDIVYVIKLPNL